MNLLELIQEFAARNTLSVPPAVASSNDAQVLQLRGLLNELLEELLTANWSGLTEEAVLSSTGVEEQGSLQTIAPLGFVRICRDTIFNRSNGLPVVGPMSGAQWQGEKALQVTRALYSFRIRKGILYLTPAPPAASVIAFEYETSWAVTPVSGTRKKYFTEDTDVCYFSDALLLSGLRYKWRATKGLDYAEELRTYDLLRGQESGNELKHSPVNLAGNLGSMRPSIYVPAGNWPLP